VRRKVLRPQELPAAARRATARRPRHGAQIAAKKSVTAQRAKMCAPSVLQHVLA